VIELIDYIKTNGLAALCDTYKILAKRHGEFPNLVMLKYSQIDSPMGERIVQQARGIILDEADDWLIVSYPFNKFFNSYEGHAATIDWSTARVYEKLDGSLMTLYWYRGQWRVASNGLPDAGGDVYGHSGTFADLFWKTWRAMNLVTPGEDDDADGCCFMFEMMTPYNRVVVQHRDSKLVCIGARDLESLKEYDPSIPGSWYGWPFVRSFPLTTADACIEAAKELNPIECEGYVVCDGSFTRIKVKCPQYVALAHMKECMSPRRMLELIRANESSEFLAYFPEWTAAYELVRREFDAAAVEIDGDYQRLKDIADQKAFALEAVKTRGSSALFAIRKGQVADAKGWMKSATLQAVERLVNLDASELIALAVQPA
jgi:hypothetical protein